jgi:mono/diheme cytochrome c family protein
MRATLILTFLSGLLVSGCATKSTDADFDSGTEDGGEDIDGAAVFSANCSACHGSDGASGSATDLTIAVPSLSDSDLMNVLENGTGDMAAPALSGAEEDGVFLYLRDRFGDHGGA